MIDLPNECLLPEIDLEPIKHNLVLAEGGPHWTAEQAEFVETWYRRYLWLCRKYSKETLVPLKAIDEFWHNHILDTAKYAADCGRVFGYFLHHFPYFGVRGESDRAAWLSAQRDTEALFVLEFGQSYAAFDAAFSLHDQPSSVCGGGGGKCRQPLLEREFRPTLATH